MFWGYERGEGFRRGWEREEGEIDGLEIKCCEDIRDWGVARERSSYYLRKVGKSRGHYGRVRITSKVEPRTTLVPTKGVVTS